MIWLIVLGILLFYGGYVLCGLLTQHKDDRIRELEGFIVRLVQVDAKKREQELKVVQELFGPKELGQRTRPGSPETH